MKKRAQITIFVLVGLGLFLILGLFIWKLRQEKVAINPLDQEKADQVQQFVELCLERTSQEGLTLLGEQGRIYPETYLEAEDQLISYFYYQGIGFFPYKISFIENDLSRYVEERVGDCLDDFSSFAYPVVAESSPKAKTSFNQNSVSVQLHYPLSIRFEDNQAVLKDFTAGVELSFLPIYELSREIFKKTRQDPAWIDVAFLTSQPYEIKLIRIDDSTLVYQITDPTQKINKQPFVYRFAMKYKL